MIKPAIRLLIDSCTQEQIETHLRSCDGDFVPPLRDRVDIPDYAEKIHAKASKFEAWCGTDLVGLVAVYFNPDTRECFVTNVSVLPDFQGQHVAMNLMSASMEKARRLRIRSTHLEVSSQNVGAIALYRKLGFTLDDRSDGIARMRYETR